jgi:hypothetical protein
LGANPPGHVASEVSKASVVVPPEFAAVETEAEVAK